MPFRRVPRINIFLGLVDADQQRPDHGAAVAGDQANARDVGVADARVFSHYRDIAKQRVGRGKADGVAVDGGNDRLVELELTGHATTTDHGVVDLAFFEDVAARAAPTSPSRRRRR